MMFTRKRSTQSAGRSMKKRVEWYDPVEAFDVDRVRMEHPFDVMYESTYPSVPAAFSGDL